MDEVLPLMLLDAASIDVAILRLENFDRLQRLLPEPGGDHFHIGPVLEGHFELRRDRFLHRRVDVLAFAVAQPREQRPHGRDRAMHAALKT